MTDSQELPAPPRLIPALVAGFDAITNHILLILFPFVLDMLIWFAPRLRMKSLIEAFLAQFAVLSARESPELTSMVEAGQEVWLQIAEGINLAVVLRAYPVGIPSLMSSISPIETPLDTPRLLEIPTLGYVILVVITLIVVGLLLGTFFYLLVAQASSGEGIKWQQAFLDWPRASLQVFLLALVWIGLLLVVSIPASCIISITTLAGFSFGQLSLLLYGGFLIWLFFPLLFSAHGIFVKGLSVWPSIRSSIRMTNTTLSTTILFVVSVFILTQGLDILWRIPPSDSWLMLLGIVGHAFVTTGLLSASFVYYRDADRWIMKMKKQLSGSPEPDLPV
jgi:hypothetical protein